MREEVIAKAIELIQKIDDFSSVHFLAESAKAENDRLKMRLDELLSNHAKSVIDELHGQILEAIVSYQEVLKSIFEKEVSGISDLLKNMANVLKEIVNQHSNLIVALELTHSAALSKIVEDHKTESKSIEALRDGFSVGLVELKSQIKDSGTQFNVTSNVAQGNFKKLLEGFTAKFEAHATEGITKEFVKDSIREILNEGFLSATQQIREVAPITRKQTEQIGEILGSVRELTDELKFLKASKKD